jgi:hypothetical protein
VNIVTINLIDNRLCYPLYKVGNMCFLDFLLEHRSLEIDLINNTLNFINNNFLNAVMYIISNSDYSLLRTLILTSFHDNHDTLLEKLANFNQFIQQIINLLNNERRQIFVNYINNNIQDITNTIFDTFLHIYVEIIDNETLEDYTDEHPRNTQRLETLVVVRNYLLNNGAIGENNFDNERIINLLNFYHDEEFENLEKYNNYF